jgi:hypothetical protein
MRRHAMKWLGVVAVLSGCALGPVAPADETDVVARRMGDLSRAIVAADQSRLEALAWPELTFGHANGRVENRAEFVSALATRKSVIPRFELSKVRTGQVGELAISRGTLAGTYLSAGKPVDFELGFVMLWQKRGGEWRLLAHQAHKL